jgi:hypothetical protein
MIEGIQVTEEHIGDPVTYIPHANGDVNHPDVEKRNHIVVQRKLPVCKINLHPANTPTEVAHENAKAHSTTLSR